MIGIGDREFAPPEISAFVLRELKQRAEEHFRESFFVAQEVRDPNSFTVFAGAIAGAYGAASSITRANRVAGPPRG